jgi:hypothetical protein
MLEINDYQYLAEKMSDKFGVKIFIQNDKNEDDSDEDFFYSILNQLERLFIDGQIMFEHGIDVTDFSNKYDDVISCLFNKFYKSTASFGCVYNYLLNKEDIIEGKVFQYIGISGNEYNITDDKTLYQAIRRMEMLGEEAPPYEIDDDEDYEQDEEYN